MADLQLFKGQKYLLYLVCFGLSFMILDINSWITSPGCFVNSMTGCTFMSFPKEIFTDFAKICISDIFGVSFHLCQYIFDFCHGYIVSIMVSLSSRNRIIFKLSQLLYFTHKRAITSRLMASRTITILMRRTETVEPLTYLSISSFYYPLALTALLSLGVQPVITFFVGHSRAALESLAVLPVVYALAFLFRALGLAYQEVGIALIGSDFEGYPQLRRFDILLGLGVAAALCLIAWTPLSTVWFHHVSGLTPELTRFALAPIRILAILPGLTVLLSFQRAMLVNLKATSHVTWATAIEVLGVIAVMLIGIHLFDMIGAIAAALALMVGRGSANLYLISPLRTLLAKRMKSSDDSA